MRGRDLQPTLETLIAVREAFCDEMKRGFSGAESSFRMLASYQKLPTGKENGCYLAVDFGGTWVRCLRINLQDQKWSIQKQQSFSLNETTADRDYTSERVSGEELFDRIAMEFAKITDAGEELLLGHVFSFPGIQTDSQTLTLLRWTKEIKTGGMIGKDVNQMLQAGLNRAGRPRIKVVSVMNDTVATLLTASFQNPVIQIGGICGTGHNLCYFEARHSDGPMVVNLESGNFNRLSQTSIDKVLDCQSSDPGKQLLEKQVGGRYLGEICRLGLVAEWGTGVPEWFTQLHSVTSSDLVEWLELGSRREWLQSRELSLSEKDENKLYEWAQGSLFRSASLVGACLAGIADYLNISENNPVGVGIDGSLYLKNRNYQKWVLKALENLQMKEKIFIQSIEDGSGIGGAIGAAMQVKK